MSSLSATFPELSALAASSPCHVLRGGFRFMIPTSFTSSQSISVAGMGGPYWNGLTNKTYFRVSQIDSLEESWSLDTWHRMDYLLTPNRMDIWLDGVQLSSRSTNAETFVGSVSASALAEVEDAWRVGGKLT